MPTSSDLSIAVRPGIPAREAESIEVLRPSLVRHLAIAAGRMARNQERPGGLSRPLHEAEARFRVLADFPPFAEGYVAALAAQPVVLLADGTATFLSDLLGDAWLRDQWQVPHRTIDPELIEAAEQLLRGLAWTLPEWGRARPS